MVGPTYESYNFLIPWEAEAIRGIELSGMPMGISELKMEITASPPPFPIGGTQAVLGVTIFRSLTWEKKNDSIVRLYGPESCSLVTWRSHTLTFIQ